MKNMRPPADEHAIETPIVLLILILVVAPLIFFEVRYEMKVRAETQAHAKREMAYQSTLRSYNQVLKPSMKRKEVEDYLRLNKIEFLQMSPYDLTKIGEEEPPWNCGTSDVYVKFRFTNVRKGESQFDTDDEDTLDEIEVYNQLDRCL
jgi:hypothetical protein